MINSNDDLESQNLESKKNKSNGYGIIGLGVALGITVSPGFFAFIAMFG